jgi:tRNA A-37 threonylcarbamoyl transferase component Bud32
MPLQPGENVGPYRIQGQLGQGGMATVYKAYHPSLDRTVALKMMHQAFLEDKTFHARFEREAQIVARLTHPHIIPIYDYAEHEGQPYLVMKFVEGRTLKGTLADGSLTLKEVVTIMTAVASALTYAHTQGVLHRDIKPSNIVIENDGTPYLTDFGLARIAERGESTLSTDMVLGTPHYMSPEQAMGRKDLDAKTDIYSLGIVLYELIVGRVPFSADTPYAVIHDHIYSPLPMPSEVNPDIPLRVEEVLLKALAKDRDDRYSSAVEMIDAFKQAVIDSRMDTLHPERASIAAVSLARLREAGAMKPPMQSVAKPQFQTASTALLRSEESIARERKVGRRWMLGGIGAFLLTCGAIFVIVMGAMRTLNALENDDSAALSLGGDGLSIGFGGSDVPIVPIERAQEAVNNEPSTDTYLLLARAYWADGDQQAARQAILDGSALIQDGAVEEQISYLTVAAAVAYEAEDTQAATLLYIALVNAGQTIPIGGDLLREEAGRYLYAITTTEGDARHLGALQIQEDLRAVVQSDYGQIFLARAQITNNRLRFARQTLNGISDDHLYQAEYNLIQGDLFAAQGSMEDARSAWERAENAPGAPLWVRERAQEQLNTSEG